ncbi:hypothetical protein SARC_01199 [Sphaeroforma arctica JP610]|uniref:C2H2-type domain-containing protein n=1 Tax=Sphaeroforma arctica JP610 TaxID=667725 RepID=A0A0L0GCD4_9EUKA|nr:hypothetical protein SARC_01199 [Sphaeroforma arctica JP610]KNC86662.1 hypothetical protein SARC_01199 [Sphaeroforma arctica JP610]|eukprot:XP_014160564.1 hypothetical protein SARC_01199 [Sphaeroforma arctica JP610]
MIQNMMAEEEEVTVGQWVRVRWEDDQFYLGSVTKATSGDNTDAVIVKFSDDREVEVPRSDVYVVGGSQDNGATTDFMVMSGGDSGCQFRTEVQATAKTLEEAKVDWTIPAATIDRPAGPMTLRSHGDDAGLYPVQHNTSRLHATQYDVDNINTRVVGTVLIKTENTVAASASTATSSSISKTEELMAAEVLSTLSNLSCDGAVTDENGIARVNSEEEKGASTASTVASPTSANGQKLRPLMIKNGKQIAERRTVSSTLTLAAKGSNSKLDGTKPLYCCLYQTCQKELGTYAGMKKHITSVHCITQYVGRYMTKITEKNASLPLARIDKVPEDVNAGIKCRKRYGVAERDQWCAKCRWKKACERV